MKIKISFFLYIFLLMNIVFAQNTRKFTLNTDSIPTYTPTSNTPELVIQEWHDGMSAYVSYCNNGKYIFSADESEVKLWDVETGYLMRTFSEDIKHPKNARMVPDASYLIYETENRNIEICNTMTKNRQSIFNLQSITDELGSETLKANFAFSGDGNYLALSYYDRIIIFNAHSLKQELVLYSNKIVYPNFPIKFSSDGKYLTAIAMPVDENTREKAGKYINVVWDISSQKFEDLNIKISEKSYVSAVSISSDGKYTAMASSEGIICIYNLIEKRFANVFQAGPDKFPIYALDFSPSGEKILSVDISGYVRLWDTKTGKALMHREPTRVESSLNLLFLSNASFDAISSNFVFTNGHSIEIYKSDEVKLIKEISQSSDLNQWSVNSKLESLCAFKMGEGVPIIFDDTNLLCTKELKHLKITTSLKMSSLESTKSTKPVIVGNGLLTAPELFDNGVYYVKQENTRSTLKLWNMKSEDETDIMVLENFNQRLLSSDNSGRIVSYVSTEEDGARLRVYDTSEKKQLRNFFFEGYYHTAKTSPAGKFVAIADDEDAKTLRTRDILLLNIESGMLKRFADCGLLGIDNISFSSDDDFCSIYNHQSGNVIYDTKNWNKVAQFKDGDISCFSNDKTLIAVNLSKKNLINIYNFPTNRIVSQISTKHPIHSFYFTKDGKRLVCQAINGIISCYSVKTGEILSSTIADSSGDWLTYTPEGYFTGSQGGINKFVHLVDGMQVFELGQMYDTLYRPDLVQAKLEGKDIGKPVLKDIVATGNVPFVQFVKTPMATSREITLDFSVLDTGGGVGYVYLSHNGKTMQVSRGEESKAGRKFTYSCKVTLAKGENVFEAYAANRQNKIESRHVSASVSWQGKVENANLYVFAMGVDTYAKMPRNNLKYSVADATALVESFKSAPGGLYNSVNVLSLFDDEVNKANIQTAFETLSAKIKPDDMFVLHIAGHGVNYDGEYYFLPADTFAKTESDYVTQGVSKHFLTENLSKIQALNTVVLLDTCYSGAFIDSKAQGNELAQKTALEHLAHTSGQVILTASSNSQTAGEGYNGHGVFTYAIMEALSGKANYNADSTLSIKEITQYIGYEIPNIYEKMGQSRQSPWNSPLRGDFSVVAAGNKAPSSSYVLALDGKSSQNEWVSVVYDDSSASAYSASMKKVAQSAEKSDQHSRAKGIYIECGSVKGAFFDGYDIGAAWYFFGGKHIFAGIDGDLLFTDISGNYKNQTDSTGIFFFDANAVVGISANIKWFRPYAAAGIGFYVSDVADAVDDSPSGLALEGMAGLDIVFRHFVLGGMYRLRKLSGSGYIDNFSVTLGWNW